MKLQLITMHPLTSGVRGVPSKKCVLRRFCCFEFAYTNPNGLAHYTPGLCYSLLILGYKPVQHGTVLNTVGSCNNSGIYESKQKRYSKNMIYKKNVVLFLGNLP